MNTAWGEFPDLVNDDWRSTLSGHGLIAVRGPDADSFLQGQLTCDIREATLEHSLLGAYCSPKGRALACFRLFRRGAAIYLELPRALVTPTLTRLNKYVLRAKVTLTNAGDHLCSMGVAGPNAATWVTQRLVAIPEAVNGVIHSGHDASSMTVIRLPGSTPRFQLYGPAPMLQALDSAPENKEEPWRLLDILTGIPAVYPETVDAFVPQMLNLDVVGGISFQKGCYTGQEIVARTHYLGKLKRRMYLARVDSLTAPQPGDPLFSPQTDAGQSAGQLADAARHPDGGYAVLAVALIHCAEQGSLHLIGNDGPKLQLQLLPYGFETTEPKSAAG